MILFRRLRRLSSFESTDLDNVWKIEFRNGTEPDTKISVYEVVDEQASVVRAQSEPCASVPLGPPRQDCDGISLSGLDGTEVVQTEGTTRFSYTRTTHREVRLDGLVALQAVVKRIAAEMKDRSRPAPKAAMKSYVRNMLDKQDPEWIAACNEEWAKWARGK